MLAILTSKNGTTIAVGFCCGPACSNRDIHLQAGNIFGVAPVTMPRTSAAKDIVMLARIAILSVLMLLHMAVLAPVAQAQSATVPLSPAAAKEFRKTLEVGLRTRKPEEFAFVALIVDKVSDGTLPRSLVESTFFWARRHQPVPFVYFEQGIKLRAKKIGVVL